MDYVSFEMIQSESEPQENISVLESSIMILRYDDMEYEYDVSGQYERDIIFFHVLIMAYGSRVPDTLRCHHDQDSLSSLEYHHFQWQYKSHGYG